MSSNPVNNYGNNPLSAATQYDINQDGTPDDIVITVASTTVNQRFGGTLQITPQGGTPYTTERTFSYDHTSALGKQLPQGWSRINRIFFDEKNTLHIVGKNQETQKEYEAVVTESQLPHVKDLPQNAPIESDQAAAEETLNRSNNRIQYELQRYKDEMGSGIHISVKVNIDAEGQVTGVSLKADKNIPSLDSLYADLDNLIRYRVPFPKHNPANGVIEISYPITYQIGTGI